MHGSRRPHAELERTELPVAQRSEQLTSDQRVGSSNFSGRANARVYKVPHGNLRRDRAAAHEHVSANRIG